LAEFRQNAGTDWELHGLEIDPGFDMAAIADPSFDPVVIWERYRPTNDQVFTSGASYCQLKWPETQGVDYRGALPPPKISEPGNKPVTSTAFLPLVTTECATE